MNLADTLKRITCFIMQIGMPLVGFYHSICDNIFLNTVDENARGVEMVGNYLLAPTQYLLAGKTIVHIDDDTLKCTLEQRYDYSKNFLIKTTASIVALPVSITMGSICKGIAYIAPSTREKHREVVQALSASDVVLNNGHYRKIGMRIHEYPSASFIGPPTHKRRPGAENYMKIEKEALRDIAHLLMKHKIPFWADCGTCLGAYRYGGVIPWDLDIDLAVLEPDFDNIRRALNDLDKKKYAVQDWSGRKIPGTYLKVYIRETGALIDLYHFAIDEKNKTIRYIISNEDNVFLPESWKIRERRYSHPIPFDVVFPLKLAKFDGITLPVPNQTKAYLQSKYGDNIEPVRVYSDKTGRYERDLSHPYWEEINVF